MSTEMIKYALAFVMLVSAFQCQAEWWWAEEPAAARIQVAEPYVEWRTGPAKVYPVFHASERGEWLTIKRRKTDWIKVSDAKGREGWLAVADVLLTKDGTGEQVSLVEPRFDDFSTRRWETGLMMGEFDSTAVNSAYMAYWMTENLSLELSASQILGSASELRLAHLNIVHQPFPQWRVSPFFTLGVGHIFIKPKATLVQSEERDSSTANAGFGLRYYVTDRYFLRMEVKDYKVFTKRETNEEATEWKIGLSVFF